LCAKRPSVSSREIAPSTGGGEYLFIIDLIVFPSFVGLGLREEKREIQEREMERQRERERERERKRERRGRREREREKEGGNIVTFAIDSESINQRKLD